MSIQDIEEEKELIEEITNPKDVSRDITEERIQTLAMKAIGQSYTPTETQVDKILYMQEKSMDYAFRERNSWNPNNISKILIIAVVIVAFMVVFLVVAFNNPEYLGEVITGFIGFVGGIGIGSSGIVRKVISNEVD